MSISVNEIRKDFPLLETESNLSGYSGDFTETVLCPGSRAGIL